MCISRQTGESGAAKYSHAFSSNNMYNLTTQRTFRQPMKPMLPRKLTSTARINLNQYWNLLEELVLCSTPMMVQQENDDQMDMSNEINENLVNERKETHDLSMTRGDKSTGPSYALVWDM